MARGRHWRWTAEGEGRRGAVPYARCLVSGDGERRLRPVFGATMAGVFGVKCSCGGSPPLPPDPHSARPPGRECDAGAFAGAVAPHQSYCTPNRLYNTGRAWCSATRCLVHRTTPALMLHRNTVDITYL